MDFLSAEKSIEAFILDKVKKAGARGVVLGLSGGIDSAVVAALAAKAVGPDNVLALIIPSPTNSQQDMQDAKDLAVKLGIHYKVLPTRPILEAFMQQLDRDEKAVGNLTARVRMCLLYYHANRLNYIVAGTGNKTELSIGYFTKYGDGGSDMLPIGDLYKRDVRDLARGMGIPKGIIDKPPTAGLWPGQTDEGEIGLTYKELDRILSGDISAAGKAPTPAELKVHKMAKSTEHKRKPPEVCKITDL